uniref:TATA element modulatory factor 1 n=1 Tax=Oncorhynchus mykiss TaxID=8022 RepID=A0A8C7LZM3_ONCMY
MSWFRSTQLSSFAKQALTTAQKSIDRVLDIKEDEWGDTVIMPYGEECVTTLPLSSEAITTAVTRAVVDGTENFFNAFLPPGELHGVMNIQILSVPPTESKSQWSSLEIVLVQTPDPPVLAQGDAHNDTDSLLISESWVESTAVPEDAQTEQPFTPSDTQPDDDVVDTSEPPSNTEPESPFDSFPTTPPKEILLEPKDCKMEDKQSNTPSPPVSTFSSGTTTSDIEVLDHESVQSESSASSRQATAEAKAGLHLMQGSFQLPVETSPVIDEMSNCLEKRELQLLTISEDKTRLEEECDNLKLEVIGLTEESSSVQSLKEEFTQSIADTERKGQLACKERDIAKKPSSSIVSSLFTGRAVHQTMEILREKEKQIRGLLEEGEKLSKQQLQHSNIKKLCLFDGKEEVEKQHRDNINKLNIVVERQEKDMTNLQNDSEEHQENNKSLQAALDNSYKELAGLHKAKASHASEAQEAVLSRETQVKEELALTLVEAHMQQDSLVNQVADLQLALQRAEQQQARKEDYLREEISNLQQVGDTHTGLFSSLLLWS